MECWCLHGAVGAASDWRPLAKQLAAGGIGSRAVDLWRFLEEGPLPLREFGRVLNAEARTSGPGSNGKALLGYSMGGRLALHALLEADHPWQAAAIISAHPGLESAADREERRSADAIWATRALTGNWDGFVAEWAAQPLLGSSTIRDAAAEIALKTRRREIARSFVDWSLGSQPPLWDQLSRINLPLLWVVGEHDTKFRKIAERAVALLPRARLAVAPAAGHRVPWDCGEWLSRELSAFLRTAIPPLAGDR